jgi:hypothetical protein
MPWWVEVDGFLEAWGGLGGDDAVIMGAWKINGRNWGMVATQGTIGIGVAPGKPIDGQPRWGQAIGQRAGAATAVDLRFFRQQWFAAAAVADRRIGTPCQYGSIYFATCINISSSALKTIVLKYRRLDCNYPEFVLFISSREA